ncbi:hypothetical protein BE18_37330 [Sorangium cellulosum]|uniref:Uncharacterized protein n=1 Tax=Sorangium cellulosum TaxID=56 RepID=A0A150T2Z9_SORCE|nr:hypothetical protein BE18_37330 [Sorangium cellulosum]
MTTARSITWRSSRMLPGQVCARSAAVASGASRGAGRPSRRARRAAKSSASGRISVMRARSGGMRSVTALRRK